MTTSQLPSPTNDLDRAGADLDEFGYCVVADVLDADTLQQARTALDDVAAAEVAAGCAYLEHDGANQRVWNLLNKGQPFLDLLVHPLARQLITGVLGKAHLLSSLTANIAGPGGLPMALHADQGYVPPPWPRPVVCNIAWMLDDFTNANGATRVVPGSHRFDRNPGRDQVDTAPAEGPAGAIMCFEGRLWHGTGANTTAGERRRAILSYHCAPFLRQQENVFRSIAPEVEAALTPELRSLLGYDTYFGLGMVDGLDPRSAP